MGDAIVFGICIFVTFGMLGWALWVIDIEPRRRERRSTIRQQQSEDELRLLTLMAWAKSSLGIH